MRRGSTYVFGDSTPANLDINYIDLLREVVDFSVEVLSASHTFLDARDRSKAATQATETEVARLEALGATITRALFAAPTGAVDSPTDRCATAIGRTVEGIVRGAVEEVVSTLADELRTIDTGAAQQRERCLNAVETLVKRHDLPGTVPGLSLTLGGGRYEARLHGRSTVGLDTTIDLEIPSSHPLAHPMRLERLFERCEVHAPGESGWLQKKVQVRPQRLDKYYLVELTANRAETLVKLRAEPEGGEGWDLLVRAEPRKAQVFRVAENGAPPGDAYDIAEEELPRMADLRDKLVATVEQLADGRRALVAAHLDGKVLRDHPDPTVLVERLVAMVAPAVHEIARHSLSPTELVLKRLLADDRREEIFVSRAELLHKIATVPEPRRALFAALALDGAPPPAAVAPAPAAARPAPSPARRAPMPRAAPRPAARPAPLELSPVELDLSDEQEPSEDEGNVIVSLEMEAEPEDETLGSKP